MTNAEFDVIIVGTGPAGEHLAGALAGQGLRLAAVERELVAGECSYWACIPSKTLLRAGEALQAAREAPGAKEAVGDARLDAGAVLAWRDFMVSDYDDSAQARWLADNDVELLRGDASLTAPGVVRVERAPEGSIEIRARDVVLAVGSDPVTPPIDGLAELDGVWHNREATGLKAVPRRLLVIGGGPVGVEMAQAIRRLGAEVALVEGADHVLSREPEPVGAAVGEALRGEGIDVRTGVHVASARRDGEDYVLVLDDGDELRGDRLLVATGRRPSTDGLGVEAGGGTIDDHGAVQVDATLRAGDGLWAIGDATGIWPLTYVGKYQARVVADNLLGRGPREAHYDAVPRVVFTDPQAAAVGVAEDRFSATVPIGEIARTATYTRAYDTKPGHLTLLSDGERLTGAHAVGPEAGEWLQQATVAIRARVDLAVLVDTIQPFPTFSEGFMTALVDLAGQVREA